MIFSVDSVITLSKESLLYTLLVSGSVFRFWIGLLALSPLVYILCSGQSILIFGMSCSQPTSMQSLFRIEFFVCNPTAVRLGFGHLALNFIISSPEAASIDAVDEDYFVHETY
jgi:hypothetical protein